MMVTIKPFFVPSKTRCKMRRLPPGVPPGAAPGGLVPGKNLVPSPQGVHTRVRITVVRPLLLQYPSICLPVQRLEDEVARKGWVRRHADASLARESKQLQQDHASRETWQRVHSDAMPPAYYVNSAKLVLR